MSELAPGQIEASGGFEALRGAQFEAEPLLGPEAERVAAIAKHAPDLGARQDVDMEAKRTGLGDEPWQRSYLTARARHRLRRQEGDGFRAVAACRGNRRQWPECHGVAAASTARLVLLRELIQRGLELIGSRSRVQELAGGAFNADGEPIPRGRHQRWRLVEVREAAGWRWRRAGWVGQRRSRGCGDGRGGRRRRLFGRLMPAGHRREQGDGQANEHRDQASHAPTSVQAARASQ